MDSKNTVSTLPRVPHNGITMAKKKQPYYVKDTQDNAGDLHDQPITVKFTEAEVKLIRAYNKQHFSGVMPRARLLRLLVTQGLTVPPAPQTEQ